MTTLAPPPDRTREQREQALSEAQQRRAATAEFRRKLRSLPRTEGCQMLADALEVRDPVTEAQRVSVLLLTIPQVKSTSLRPMLAKAGMAFVEMKGRELTDQERAGLVAVLRGGSATWPTPASTVPSVPFDEQVKAAASVLERVLPPAAPHHRIAEKCLLAARDAA